MTSINGTTVIEPQGTATFEASVVMGQQPTLTLTITIDGQEGSSIDLSSGMPVQVNQKATTGTSLSGYLVVDSGQQVVQFCGSSDGTGTGSLTFNSGSCSVGMNAVVGILLP